MRMDSKFGNDASIRADHTTKRKNMFLSMEIRRLKIGAEFIGDSVREICRKKFFCLRYFAARVRKTQPRKLLKMLVLLTPHDTSF